LYKRSLVIVWLAAGEKEKALAFLVVRKCAAFFFLFFLFGVLVGLNTPLLSLPLQPASFFRRPIAALEY